MKKSTAFSLIELSIVIVIIGILILGITKGSRIIRSAKLTSARTLTKSSPVPSIPNLVYWFEPTSAASFKNQNGSTNIQDGDTVSSWFDSNPLNQTTISVDQSTAANQPKYIASGINGLPSVRFDTTNSNMILIKAGIMANYNVDITMFAVFKFYNSHNINSEILGVGGFAGKTFEAVHEFTVNPSFVMSATFWNTGNEEAETTAANYAIKNKVYLLTNTMDTTRALGKFTINGVVAPVTLAAITTKGTYGSGGTQGVAIGNHKDLDRTLDGDISEIIIYDRVLKDGEITAVQNYLIQKYNIR